MKRVGEQGGGEGKGRSREGNKGGGGERGRMGSSGAPRHATARPDHRLQ